MKYNLTIYIPTTYTDDDSTFPKPVNENYNYWIALIGHFLKKSDTIEIHCWNEETGTIDEINSLYKGNFEVVKEENLTIFKGTKSPFLMDYLLNKCVNNNGELKWFTLNLEKLGLNVFHSGHWGTELVIPNISKEDIDFIKSVTPKETDFQEF